MTGIRESKKEEKKERLLKESLELFIEKGFDQTSIEDITGKAGVAKGTFYNFFEKRKMFCFIILTERWLRAAMKSSRISVT